MNRKQRRALTAMKRRGQEVDMAKSLEDSVKEQYFHKCAAAGELQLNIQRMQKSLEGLLKELQGLTEQFNVIQKAKDNANEISPAASQPAGNEGPTSVDPASSGQQGISSAVVTQLEGQ
jgi:hypothetical protein